MCVFRKSFFTLPRLSSLNSWFYRLNFKLNSIHISLLFHFYHNFLMFLTPSMNWFSTLSYFSGISMIWKMIQVDIKGGYTYNKAISQLIHRPDKCIQSYWCRFFFIIWHPFCIYQMKKSTVYWQYFLLNTCLFTFIATSLNMIFFPVLNKKDTLTGALTNPKKLYLDKNSNLF